MAHSLKRAGFTIVELLVVIAIIGILASLLMWGIQSARDTSMRARCQSNLKTLSLGIKSFETVRHRFPGYHESIARTAKEPNGVRVPWTVAILNHIEQGNLYDNWKETLKNYPTGDSVAENNPLKPSIDIFLCSSDPIKLSDPATNPFKDPGLSPLSYVANAGLYTGINGAASEKPANGVFHNFYATKTKTIITDFVDGLSNTLLLSENLENFVDWYNVDARTTVQINNSDPQRLKEAHVFVWHATLTPTNDERLNRSINGYTEKDIDGNGSIERFTRDDIDGDGDPKNNFYYRYRGKNLNEDTARPSSVHNRGVNVSFADGSVRFLRQDIDYRVYQQLMTPHGQKSDMPDKTYLLKDNDYR